MEKVAVKEMKVSALEKQMAFIAILEDNTKFYQCAEAGPSTSSVTKVWCLTPNLHML